MTRVIHTGDTHIGYRQYHSPVRRQDYLDAFRQVVEDAVADEVDAVVHAGDLFNDRRPDLPDLLETIAILRTLERADVPFLAIVGNHEDSRNGQWLDLFETLELATHLDASGTVIGDTTFYGLDYVPASRRDRLDYDFTPPETEHTALVSHGLFAPFPHGDWDLETVLEESSIDFDAVLLGDDHVPKTQRLGETWATYCGSTERTSASERDPRGYNLVEFTSDDVAISRRGLDTRDFVFVDVDLEASEGPGFVTERIREADVEDSVVIVTIEGDGEQLTPAEIEQFGQERGALVTRVNDRRDVEGADEAIEVSFADPDEAVTERVRELGLSEAARTVDETIRDGDIADSNVRSRVKSRVEDLLDEPDAFESAPEPESSAAEPGEDQQMEQDDADDSRNPDDGDEPANSVETDDSRNPDDGDDSRNPDDADDPANQDEVDDSAPSDEPTESTTDQEDAANPATSQSTTMEDFL